VKTATNGFDGSRRRTERIKAMKFDSIIADVKSLDEAVSVGERIFDATTTEPEQVTGDGPKWHARERTLLITLVSRAARECLPGSSPVVRMQEVLNLGATKFEKPLTAEEKLLLNECKENCLDPMVFARVAGRLRSLN
jgi:hypothetical protein